MGKRPAYARPRRSLRQATYPQPPNTRKRHPAELYQAQEGSRLRAKWGAQLPAIRQRGVPIRLLCAESHVSCGVTCSDCHEPHSLALRAEGNALCGQCHLPAKFDTAEHHHPRTRQHRRPVRQLPYADEDLHGGGSQAGSQHSCSAAGPVGVDWHPERVHPVSHQQVNGLGDARHRWMVSARPGTQAHYATALNAGRTGALDAETTT